MFLLSEISGKMLRPQCRALTLEFLASLQVPQAPGTFRRASCFCSNSSNVTVEANFANCYIHFFVRKKQCGNPNSFEIESLTWTLFLKSSSESFCKLETVLLEAVLLQTFSWNCLLGTLFFEPHKNFSCENSSGTFYWNLQLQPSTLYWNHSWNFCGSCCWSPLAFFWASSKTFSLLLQSWFFETFIWNLEFSYQASLLLEPNLFTGILDSVLESFCPHLCWNIRQIC